METKEDKRKYAAYLARQFYAGKKQKKEIEDEFPYSDSDADLQRLLQLIKKTPKRKGLFKVSTEKYEKYVLNVYELIKKLEE